MVKQETNLHQIIAKMKLDSANKQASLDDLNQKISDKDGFIQTIQAEIDKKVTNINMLEENISAMKLNIEQQKNEIKCLKTLTNTQNMKILKYDYDKSRLQSYNDQAEEIKHLKNELEQMKLKLKEKPKTVMKLFSKSMDEHDGDTTPGLIVVKSKEDQKNLKEKDNNISKLELQLINLQSGYDELIKEHSALMRSSSEFEAERKCLMKKMDELEIECAKKPAGSNNFQIHLVIFCCLFIVFVLKLISLV